MFGSKDYENPYWTKMKGGRNYRLHVSDSLFFAEGNKKYAYQRAVSYYEKHNRDYPLPLFEDIEDRGEVDESHG